jgi:cyclase
VAEEHRKLIVARIETEDLDAVARLWAESDASELPHLVGVRRRSLFRLRDLYLHLIESDHDITPDLGKVKDNPLYQDISERMKPFVRAYHPSFRTPKDTFAEEFYRWESQR